MSKIISDEEQSKFIEFPVEGYTTDRPRLCEAQAKDSDRQWIEAGDELVNSLRFSPSLVSGFWQALKNKMEEK